MRYYTLDFEKPVLELEKQLNGLREKAAEQKIDLGDEIAAMERKIDETKRRVYSQLSAWQRVQISRHPKRPYFMDYVGAAFENFTELHGDRRYSDDHALIGGFAWLKTGGKPQRVMVLGHQKGRNTKENLYRNFGMAHPEGYRKALRLMQLASKFGTPIIAFIDTPGAYPGVQAEERHIAEAIAVNLREMFLLETPILAVVIGEGGSGGALGIGVADRVLIMENAYYSVISPEGCAAILWKDRAHAPASAEALKLSARNLLSFKLVDDVIPEPLGGAHQNMEVSAENLRQSLCKHLSALQKLPTPDLLEQRYERYRGIGQYGEK
ncbi:MAG: acetyl-CoA carboxylase carboxyltransferase subunit alpha [Verrucomicrobiae bacterium]|nr:acetyl-CoA carboxylase carboxyltransferase subunit alpha [Verrucomicrobiae bacterium]